MTPRSTIVEFSPSVTDGFSSAVSLHAHSCYSRESLSFLPGMAAAVPSVGRLLAFQAARYRRCYARDLDFGRAYWRPPLTPRAVIDSELRHIAAGLGLRPIVSLTDHDTTEGVAALAGGAPPCEAPLSFEWTLPTRTACFHLGVHNLPAAEAAEIGTRCAELTRRPDAGGLLALLDRLHGLPGTLVVLNHPLWDSRRAGAQETGALTDWLNRHRHFVDALEINGFRSWRENLNVASLAERLGLPLVSGGDRHARAPNAVLNLTRARTFADFAAQVRHDRHSRIVVMPAYREHRASRTLEAAAEVLRQDPHLATGHRWVHRVFHLSEEHGEVPVAHYWENGEPFWLRLAVGLTCWLGGPHLRPARRLALLGEPGGGR